MKASKLWTMALGLGPGTSSAAGAAMKKDWDCEHTRNLARGAGVDEPDAPSSRVAEECVLCVEQALTASAAEIVE